MKQIKLSNNLKAIMIMGDVTNESAHYYQSDCITVQTFNYSLDRMLDSRGVPYGKANVTTLEVSVRVMQEAQMKALFGMLVAMNCNDFSFLFNTTFAPDGSVVDKEDAMVVHGLVVDIKETFQSKANDANNQMSISFKILVSNIIFLGSDSDKTLILSRI